MPLYAYAYCSAHLTFTSSNIEHANFKGVRLYTSTSCKIAARGGVSRHKVYDSRLSRHLLSWIERGERICMPLLFLPPAVSRRAEGPVVRRHRVSRRWFIKSWRDRRDRDSNGRDSSTIRDDESANVSSSGAPLESTRM